MLPQLTSVLAAGIVVLAAGLCPAKVVPTVDVDKLVTAIGKAENSRTRPYGVMSKHRLTPAQARRICERTVREIVGYWEADGRRKDLIAWIGMFYSPTQDCDNDPQGLNRNWVRNVKAIYARL